MHLRGFQLTIPLYSQRNCLNFVTGGGNLKRIGEALPQGLGKYRPLFRWQPKRLSSNLVDTHGRNIHSATRRGKGCFWPNAQCSHNGPPALASQPDGFLPLAGTTG